MSGQMITITMTDGTSVEAYAARPAGEGPWPGLVILSEIYNANAWVRAVADGYAEQGFLCLAPDLYWRQNPGQYLEYTPEGQQAARELGFSMDLDAFTGDMADYVSALTQDDGCTGKVGTVGYCLGGEACIPRSGTPGCGCWRWLHAVQLDAFLDEADKVNAPLLLHFAELDEHVPQETVALVKDALADKANVSIYDYPGTQHGFNRFGYPPHHPESAAKALERSLSFLRANLG